MICIVGDILTDVTLATPTTPYKMRLGGIVHAARGLWAMGVDYAVAYFAPSYMDGLIAKGLKSYGCKAIHKLGNVSGCPYTMLISEVKEIGNQGYEFLYRDCVSIEYYEDELKKLGDYDELLLTSGNFAMNLVLNYIKPNQKVHSDVANNIKQIQELPNARRMNTLFISTSSELFLNSFTNIETFFEMLSSYAERIVLKENRGGSRAFDTETGEISQIPSQTSTIAHSVGVGDVYDSVAISAPFARFEERLNVASWVAMHYAKTTFCEDFQKAVSGVLKIPVATLMEFEGGCQLPWEIRQRCVLYIAAPDFDFLDTRAIDMLCNSLTYHHFVPRRPIKEVGQMTVDADKQERQRLYHGDMAILDECNMLIAVLLNNDPGTLIEIGIAVQKGLTTIVYDPYRIANNCMLTECPTLVSNDLDTIITKVFIEYSKQYKNGTL